MLAQEKKCAGRIKWKFAPVVFVCLAALVGAGKPAHAGPLSGSDDSPQQGLVQPLSATTADFSLALFTAYSAGLKGYGARPIKSAIQEQPFVEPPVYLRDDDPEFNKRSPLWSVILRVVTSNVVVWAYDRFIFNYSWSHISPQSWKHNLKIGWEWDTDRFGMNFFFHPLTGASYFSAARSNGYNYLESLPFTFLGSLTWEYFGETTRPSYNDIINTTLSGAFMGEFLYRIGSNILDDRTTGVERFFRELTVAILSPGRALGRLLQGKLTRVTTKEIYQKEPLNISFSLGAHWFNKGTRFGTGSSSEMLNIHLDYGDPFESRPRKPFDFFKARVDLSYGKNIGGKYLDNVIGYGLLFGKTLHSGKWDILIGAFQHFDFWDSRVFEIGALAFGGGIITKWRMSEKSNFQGVFHLGIVPLAASNSPNIDIVEEGVHLRNYDYSGGGEAKLEGTLNLADRVQMSAVYFLYRLTTYVGPPGYKNIVVFKPRLAVRLFSNLSLGFEYLFYHKDTYLRNYADVSKRSDEQKLYLLLYF